jgi:hypothetical protein
MASSEITCASIQSQKGLKNKFRGKKPRKVGKIAQVEAVSGAASLYFGWLFTNTVN